MEMSTSAGAEVFAEVFESEVLSSLEAGQKIVFGGNKITRVGADLAENFVEGDKLLVVDETGDLLHIPASDNAIAELAVSEAEAAFGKLSQIDDAQIDLFFGLFAKRLGKNEISDKILAANAADIERAKTRSRSTTRLKLSQQMLLDMIEGLEVWPRIDPVRNKTLETIEHDGWKLEQKRAGLGVIAFVFEGRPNVFADACGVLKSGNTTVLRIGSDALGTAKAIMEHALNPALAEAGLPNGSVGLIDSTAHAAGWALFNDQRLALAVARGSGAAVAQLGAVARQAGNPVSLHGTGGAWLVAGQYCEPDRLETVVLNSLDRKVCNTLNTCCVLASRAEELIPKVLSALEAAAAEVGVNPKLHVADSANKFVPQNWFDKMVEIGRASGPQQEPQAELIGEESLGTEWEWETSPEITIAVVETVADAVELFNSQSPRFVASLISSNASEQEDFWASIDAPFVGDGFTRWVDGQYALNQPELGLSNWQHGRLLARGAILSGESLYTVRTKMTQTDSAKKR